MASAKYKNRDLDSDAATFGSLWLLVLKVVYC